MLKFYYSHVNYYCVNWTDGIDAACTLLVLLLLLAELLEELSASSCEQNCEQDRRARPHNPETRLNGTMAGKLPCFPRLDPSPMPAILYQYRLKYPGKVPSPLIIINHWNPES